MTTAIRCEGMSKKYRLKAPSVGSTFREMLEEKMRALGRQASAATSEFWALKDVSFEVPHGEVFGVIGRNGAGKSTLLKILSRITEPTSGRAEIFGRVASLLEVGIGFHSELTGRENIFLGGALLGMRASEIREKFDAIVDFAETGRFLDMPVKHYSSGMYVRLAFAVAAFLETEILLVDEVLAVGDAAFQKKCLGRMQDVAHSGRTVLFVSHSMATVSSLCRRSMLLDGGVVRKIGPTSEIILDYYGDEDSSPASARFLSEERVIGDASAILLAASVIGADGKPRPEFGIGESFKVSMRWRVLQGGKRRFVPNFHFTTHSGVQAFVTSTRLEKDLAPGEYETQCTIPANMLNEGVYFVGIALSSFEDGVTVHFFEPSAVCFNVRDPIDEVPTRNGYSGPIPGVVRPLLEWNVRKVS